MLLSCSDDYTMKLCLSKHFKGHWVSFHGMVWLCLVSFYSGSAFFSFFFLINFACPLKIEAFSVRQCKFGYCFGISELPDIKVVYPSSGSVFHLMFEFSLKLWLCFFLWHKCGYLWCCSVLLRKKSNIDLMASDFQCLVSNFCWFLFLKYYFSILVNSG